MAEEREAAEELDLTTRHVRSAVRGAAESRAWLVARFTPLLLAQAAHRIGPALRRTVDPEDLVQDTWLRVLPRLDGLRARDGRLTPVVLRFASTTLLNRLNSLLQTQLRRGALHAAGGDEELDEAAQDQTELVSGVVRRERASAVRAAVEELDDETRAIVVLRGIEQNAVADVALLLGLVPNTVTVKYRRALQKLRDRVPRSIFDELTAE
ncbi:MAG: sigma-70 family RNA polymerase sigma factor [Planctomycetota bacterium]